MDPQQPPRSRSDDDPRSDRPVPAPDLDEETRHDRADGGDAQPAGSIADREAVANDDDDLFEGDDDS